MAKLFTLPEARSLLPLVGRLVREAVQAKSRYDEAETYLHQLGQRILMQGGLSVDTALAESWKNQRDNSGQILKTSMERIAGIGVQVKDLDIGLIDFPTLYRGQEVCICWRMDEDDIEYWHGAHEGFAGRKEIDDDFLANHTGNDETPG